MTAKSDIAAITPTTTARANTAKAGHSVDALLALAQVKAVELRLLVAQIIAMTPGGDANLSSLNAILAELA
jgi:hypothetical protein